MSIATLSIKLYFPIVRVILLPPRDAKFDKCGIVSIPLKSEVCAFGVGDLSPPCLLDLCALEGIECPDYTICFKKSCISYIWVVFNKMNISANVVHFEHIIRYIGVFSEASGWLTYYMEELVVTKTSEFHVEKPKVPSKQKSKKKRPPVLR